MHTGKKACLTNATGQNVGLHIQKSPNRFNFSRCTQLYFKRIKDLITKPNTLKLIDEKVGNSLEHIGTEKNFRREHQ